MVQQHNSATLPLTNGVSALNFLTYQNSRAYKKGSVYTMCDNHYKNPRHVCHDKNVKIFIKRFKGN